VNSTVSQHKPHWTELPPVWRWVIGTTLQGADVALKLGCVALIGASTWVMVDKDANQRFTLRRADVAAVATMGQGTTYASPIVGKTLDDLVAYQPSFGQSFGPETGNMRRYGPHGGVDFDARVGGAAGADVASPIAGKVSEIRKIGTSANGASYQVHIQGTDWAGAVEHQLVHVDHIAVTVGDTVAAGQVVAKVSPTDSVSTGPHLDWKIKRGGRWVNPQTWAKDATGQNAAQQQAPAAAPGEPIPDDLLKRAIGRAEGTRDANGNPTAAYHGHKDPGWSGRCQNQGSFSYQHCADSPEAADQSWLGTLRKAEQDINAQAQAKFGQPLSQAAMVAALDGYTQSPDAGKRFVGVLPSADPSPQQIIAARTAALDASRRAKGGPPMNVPRDQQRRVNALLEQLGR
jgi:biotin carboxyl carrier protein